jgi:hypothetical protein
LPFAVLVTVAMSETPPFPDAGSLAPAIAGG